VAQKKSRQTFEKFKREQAVKEKRQRKQERKAAARLAKLDGSAEAVDVENDVDDDQAEAAPGDAG